MHLHEMGGELNVGASQEERSGGCVGGGLVYFILPDDPDWCKQT